jgi:folate-binding protein YgfZ
MAAADRAAVEAGYQALRQAVGAVALDRDVLRVTGPGAVEWLQGQLSQDVAALAIGESAWSLLLQPQGKVDALVRVTRAGDAELVLDTDAGWGEPVRARLERFKLRVKADVEPLAWRCVGLRGPLAGEVELDPSGGVTVAHVVPAWPTLLGLDLLGPAPAVPAHVPVVVAAAHEALRIEAGLPRMGAELDERTIPAEAGVVAHTVSFTKGCYTGQELVARIDSRGGHVPRHLRAVVVPDADADGLPATGTAVVVDGKEVGALTSVAWSPARGVVALAYVARAVEPPAAAQLVPAAGAPLVAGVETLPLLSDVRASEHGRPAE